MSRLLAFLVVILSLPVPAQGQDKSLADHLATVMFGIQDGSRGPLGKAVATIKESDPGVFEVVDASGATAFKLTFTAIEACLFDVAFEVPGRETAKTRIDPKKLTRVTYIPRDTDSNGLTMFVIDAELEPGFNVRTNLDGTRVEDDLSDMFRTDLPLATLDASAAALKAACP